MVQRKRSNVHEGSGVRRTAPAAHTLRFVEPSPKKDLEIVLKCDSFGSVEAVRGILTAVKVSGVAIRVISSGVGAISQSDLQMAMTGSKLVVGFNVKPVAKVDQWVKEHGAEIRLYNVIHALADDLKRIAESFVAVPEPEERITGKAKVIALFKSTHRGIILGCQITEGTLAVGKHFRIIAAMGPVYTGRIESLQIEKGSIKEAKVGQQVGIKIEDFKEGKVGDFIECFEKEKVRGTPIWKPSGNVLHFEV